MQVASPPMSTKCGAKAGKAKDRNRILAIKRFRLHKAHKGSLNSSRQQLELQQAAEQVQAQKEGILMVKKSILSNHSEESEI